MKLLGTKRGAEDVGGNVARVSKTSRTEKSGDGSKKAGNKAAKKVCATASSVSRLG